MTDTHLWDGTPQSRGTHVVQMTSQPVEEGVGAALGVDDVTQLKHKVLKSSMGKHLVLLLH